MYRHHDPDPWFQPEAYQGPLKMSSKNLYTENCYNNFMNSYNFSVPLFQVINLSNFLLGMNVMIFEAPHWYHIVDNHMCVLCMQNSYIYRLQGLFELKMCSFRFTCCLLLKSMWYCTHCSQSSMPVRILRNKLEWKGTECSLIHCKIQLPGQWQRNFGNIWS